jgi:ribonuclease D
MMTSPPDPSLITDPRSLQALAERLAGAPRVALDTEAASFHRYVDRLYLLQLSSDDETAVVDPLAVGDLGPVGLLLASPDVEIILHDADYDLRIMHRDYGFTACRVWDTRVAAQLAGEGAVGLGALLERYFGVRLSKHLQRADWSQRPLSEEMIAYAAADTAYLPGLRDFLADRLTQMGRMHWAEEEFLRLERLRWTPRAVEGQEFLSMKGARTLRPPQLAVLRGLWEWRDTVASELDRAPFRVAGNEVLLAIAREAPVTPEALRRIRGVPPRIADRHGHQFLAIVRAARALPESAWPRFERRPRTRPDPQVDERLSRLKALRAERAPAVGLEPGLVCANAVLAAIAGAAARTPADLDAIADLRRWQREVLGDAAILRAAE